MDHLCPSKQRTYPLQFSRLSKIEALTPSTEDLHREAATPYRILQGTPTLVSLKSRNVD